MASSSGNSSTTKFQSSGSEEDLQNLMDQRKNKRKQSNRESARRSRMRKQSHLDELMKQVSQLTKDNSEILRSIEITTQHYLTVESENSVLRAQLGELGQRLQSLNDIISLINSTTTEAYERDCYLTSASAAAAESFINPMTMNMNMNMNMLYLNQPISASADTIFQW